MDYMLAVTDEYNYVAEAVTSEGLSMMKRLAPVEGPYGYAELAKAVKPDRTCAVLRTSGKFSLVDRLPDEDSLNRALATNEDQEHMWSGMPTDHAPDGLGAAVVSAVLRRYLESGGSRETLHALVDAL